MKTQDFDYPLPSERIAQIPVEPRDHARLMLLNRQSGEVGHSVFTQLPDYLEVGDLLVYNETRVIPARLYGHKQPGGGKIEILLLRRVSSRRWEAMVGGKGMQVGRKFWIPASGSEGEPLTGEVVDMLDGPRRLLQFDQPVRQQLDRVGNIPLPPYIHEALDDPDRYQTIFARTPGSAAALTADLHCTNDLFELMDQKGVLRATVTLHIGLDTFAPVQVEDPTQHHIHTEWAEVTPETARAVNQAKKEGRRVVSVGTTSVRTLETAARYPAGAERVGAFSGQTDLFILPGYEFRVVDAMITNFHLPKSTLLMMISAFAGRENVLAAYHAALHEQYRFFSFGDGMLIA
jgi:S-adenosylmethionine:tRNA ribosyltransferase-isomerase